MCEFFHAIKIGQDIRFLSGNCVDPDAIKTACVKIMNMSLEKLRRNSSHVLTPCVEFAAAAVSFDDNSLLSQLLNSSNQPMSDRSILFHKLLVSLIVDFVDFFEKWC